MSLSVLLAMLIRYLDAYERVKFWFSPDSISGRILNSIVLAYSSELNFATVIGFK